MSSVKGWLKAAGVTLRAKKGTIAYYFSDIASGADMSSYIPRDTVTL